MNFKLTFLFFLSSLVFGQSYKIVDYGTSGKSMLVGTSPREAFQDSNFAWWFNSEYSDYIADTNTINDHKNLLDGKIIKIVLGTWCGDSRREVPRFVKILDYCEFPANQIFYINVDRDKKGLSNEVDGLNIEYVPTFIVYENDKELGRIIEAPEATLEEDLVQIVK